MLAKGLYLTYFVPVLFKLASRTAICILNVIILCAALLMDSMIAHAILTCTKYATLCINNMHN